MKDLFLNIFKYSQAKIFFLVIAGTFTFIIPVRSSVQDINAVDLDGFAREMAAGRFLSEENAKCSSYMAVKFSDDSTPTAAGTSKTERKDHLKTAISVTSGGSLGWGSVSKVLH